MANQFLSCDWGSSSFRLRLLDADSNKVLSGFTERTGIADVHHHFIQSGLKEEERISFYRKVLQQFIAQLNVPGISGLPILMSGMASSSIGFQEIEYGELPFDLATDRLPVHHIPKEEPFNHDVFIISGLKTANDAMRGEETILFGCDTKHNDGIYIFPGTHSKHVLVQGNIAVEVKTYMTGELFDLLANKSVISTSVLKNEMSGMEQFFTAGVQDAMSGSFLHTIFKSRINYLFKTMQPAENYHYLSGLLIGTEMKEIGKENNVFIVSENVLLSNYLKAAEVLQFNNVKTINSDVAMINAHFKLAALLLN